MESMVDADRHFPARSKAPLVTVLMTVRNGEPYVRQAVASVLEQSMGDLELLVVDNASTDASLDTVRSFGDGRVRIRLNGCDLGRTRALNVGLRHARGEFVAVLDADDLADPERLALQTDFLRRHPGVAMAGGGYRAIDQQGRLLAEHSMPLTHQDILNCFPVWNPIPHSTMIFRRRAVMDMGGYPSAYIWAQDYALILKMARRHALANLPQTLGAIRQHPEQMTALPAHAAHKLLESYQLLRKGRSLAGVSPASKAEGRTVCAGLARDYLALLDGLGRHGRAFAFRLSCLLGDPRDRELRKALGLGPRNGLLLKPVQPQSGVDG